MHGTANIKSSDDGLLHFQGSRVSDVHHPVFQSKHNTTRSEFLNMALNEGSSLLGYDVVRMGHRVTAHKDDSTRQRFKELVCFRPQVKTEERTYPARSGGHLTKPGAFQLSNHRQQINLLTAIGLASSDSMFYARRPSSYTLHHQQITWHAVWKFIKSIDPILHQSFHALTNHLLRPPFPSGFLVYSLSFMYIVSCPPHS